MRLGKTWKIVGFSFLQNGYLTDITFHTQNIIFKFFLQIKW